MTSSVCEYSPRNFFRAQLGLAKRFERRLTRDRELSLEACRNRGLQHAYTATIQAIDIEREDERYLLSGSADGSLAIFDLETPFVGGKQECKSVASVQRGSKNAHAYGVRCLYFYPGDSGLFVSSGGDSVLKIWDANRMIPAEQLLISDGINQHHMSSASGSDVLIAVASNSSLLRLVDLRTGYANQTLRGHVGNIRCVQWSPADARLIASGSGDGKVLLWDIRSGKTFLKSLVTSRARPNACSNRPQDFAHAGAICGLRFTQDGQFLASYGSEGMLRLWDSVLGLEATIANRENEVASSCSLRENVQIELGCFDEVHSDDQLIFLPLENDVKCLNLRSGKCQRILRGHFRQVTCCAYRRRYQELYTASSDKTVVLWAPAMDRQFGFGNTDPTEKRNVQDFMTDNWD